MAMETWPAFNQRPAGRADLVRALIALGEDSLERSARLLGYEEDQAEEEWPEKIKPRFISIPQEDLPDIDHRREPALDKAPVVPKPIGRFYRMTRYRAISSEERQRAKTAYQQARALGASELEANPDIVPMKVPPLAPWKRLWPFLHWVLGAQWEGRRLDVASAVVQLSQGRVLKRIPYLSVQSWAITCQIIVEICPRTDLFRDDFAELCTKVMQMRGRSGLDIVVLREGPAALCRPDVFQEQAYRIPDPATPVLILSDLGHYDSSGIESRTWCRFVRGLKKKGLHPVALTPTPPRLWNVALANLIPLVSWDRARKLPTVLQRPSLAKSADTFGSSAKLLNLLAPAVRVEPPLLRAARYLLSVQEADVAEEAAAWLHTDVSATVNGFAYLPEKKQKFRNSFKLQKKELKTAVCHAIDIYHRHLAPDVRTEEALNCDELAGIHCKEAIERSWRVARTLAGQRDAPAGMAPWFDRLTQRQSKDMWRRYPALEVAWYCRHQDALETGESIAKPNGLNVARAASIALQQSGPTRYGLCQTSQFLEVREIGDTAVKPPQNGFEKLSSPLAEIESTTPYLYWQWRDLSDGTESSEILDVRRETQALPLMIRDGRLTVYSDRAEIVLHDRMSKPSWANRIGRDRYGLYTDFTFRGVTQRLRWINPGRFMMGSPADEVNRSVDEILHEVIMTRGFWLADTACTQGLWRAVMGQNPSLSNQGDDYPVESVSWEDVNAFIERINREIPDLALRLPSEAEWEYACRAGTQSPFSFGETIITDQVNYNGDHPYAGGNRGENRGKAVEVSALPANGWGLYQMHGNVWEWCYDWYGRYQTGPVTDPKGPEAGGSRVLRGGSWFSGGGGARSAQRSGSAPGIRGSDFGFRLARGPEEQVRREGSE
jgi:formylglycine-generating enzyme required for sulfatase activity